jgi:predicted Zn finger-like uncharacterized protein
MSDVGTVRELTSMKVTCPSCGSVFPVDPLRVPPQGILAICTACLRTFPVLRPRGTGFSGFDGDGDTASGTVSPQAPDPPTAPAPEDRPGEVISQWDADLAEVAAAGSTPEAPGVSGDEGLGAATAHPVTPESGPAAAPADEEATEEETAGDGPEASPEDSVGETSEGAPAADPGPAAPQATEKEDTSPPRVFGGSAGAASGVAAGAARFGSRDPSERARRLARVLASDMITYNPARYADARKSGTLVEDFRDEIEKSWEEYVDQVGGELARETTHFVDALNEVLARGETLFQGPGFPYDDPPA